MHTSRAPLANCGMNAGAVAELLHGDRSVDVFVRKLRQKLEKVSPDWSVLAEA